MNTINALPSPAASGVSATSQAAPTAQQGADFAQTLDSAMLLSQASASAQAAAALAGNPMDSLAAAQYSSTNAMMGAAANGNLQSALLMLCMMMQSGGGSAMLPMLMMLSGMVDKMGDDEKEALRKSLMDSGYTHEVLDDVNTQVFHKTDGEAFPYEYWKPTNPPLTNQAGNRSAQSYNAVIDQFNVSQNGRYAPYRNGSDTYCNIYVWDVTRAMGAEIPHYIDAQTGDIAGYPPPKGALETTANRLYDWLDKHGSRYGWVEVDEAAAQRAANAGQPAVTVRKNPSGSGHVQMVRPSADGTFDAQKGAVVAQAGSRLVNYAHNGDLFSASTRSQLRYYIHS